MRYWRLPRVMFEPFEAMVPKVQAHLSAFSAPRVSYQAFRSGSEVVSSNSWEMMEIMPSPLPPPLGPVTSHSQADGQRAEAPMKEYLMSEPPMVPWVCQPQY